MTAKQFFKSKAFKCIIVLFCVLLLSGCILTIANGFLAVSAGEKLQRAISNIYSGETVTVYGYEDEIIDSDTANPKSLVTETATYGDAQILEAYKITFSDNEEVNYLVSSKGLHGYGEGYVTCWVAVKVDLTLKRVTSVEKVTVSANSGQSFISKITDGMLSSFTEELPEGGYSTDAGYVSTGASYSSRAICNAVNGAVSYVNSLLADTSSVAEKEGI